jgi:hypothetical protein
MIIWIPTLSCPTHSHQLLDILHQANSGGTNPESLNTHAPASQVKAFKGLEWSSKGLLHILTINIGHHIFQEPELNTKFL